MEYFIIVIYLALCHLVFRNKFLGSKTWFIYITLGLGLAAIVYFIIGTWKDLTITEFALLMIVFAGIVFTSLKRLSSICEEIDRNQM